MLDESIAGDEGIILACKLLDQLLVFVELLQIICGHGVDSVVFSPINIVLITKDTVQELGKNSASNIDPITIAFEGRTIGSCQAGEPWGASLFPKSACHAADHNS